MAPPGSKGRQETPPLSFGRAPPQALRGRFWADLGRELSAQAGKDQLLATEALTRIYVRKLNSIC